MTTILVKLGLPLLFLVILGIFIYLAVKSSKNLPEGKPVHKLSRKQLIRRYRK